MSNNSDDNIELESPNFRESMCPQEVSAWLKYNGIPGKFSDLFEGIYLHPASNSVLPMIFKFCFRKLHRWQ